MIWRQNFENEYENGYEDFYFYEQNDFDFLFHPLHSDPEIQSEEEIVFEMP